jgi:hypothetical protein
MVNIRTFRIELDASIEALLCRGVVPGSSVAENEEGEDIGVLRGDVQGGLKRRGCLVESVFVKHQLGKEDVSLGAVGKKLEGIPEDFLGFPVFLLGNEDASLELSSPGHVFLVELVFHEKHPAQAFGRNGRVALLQCLTCPGQMFLKLLERVHSIYTLRVNRA